MSADLEEQKKLLLPILQRAEEIQTVEPRVAYYCRLYAIKKGLEIPNPAREISGLIKATFAQCEKDKPHVQPNADKDRLLCENFALNVFRRADKVDRAGRADMNTCKAFYAAAIFLQVLEQFLERGEDPEVVSPDLVEKIRYALWRAAEIRKALREGRQPAPPPDIDAGAAAPTAAGTADDLFGGNAYEQSNQGQHYQQQQQNTSGDGGNMDSITSSTDEFLDLPRPPSTVPPEGSVGLLPPAAAAGPRFKPGSRVWCGCGAAPEEGTVGMVLSLAGGPGGQAVYKVALKSRLEQLTDSQLAPAVTAGDRVMYVASHGDSPELAYVVAANVEQWPVSYLLQFDNGHNLSTDAGHVSLAAAGTSSHYHTPSQPPASSDLNAVVLAGASATGGSRPPATSISGHSQPPAAPPLVDHHTAPPPTSALPTDPHAPGTAAAGGTSSYPAIGPGGSQYNRATPSAAAPPGHQPPPPPAGSTTSGTTGGVGHYPAYTPGRTPAGSPHAPGRTTAQQTPAAAATSTPGALSAGGQQIPSTPAGSSFQPSPSAISEAQKYAKYAASSLAFDDVSGGVKYLTDALRLLTQPSGR